VNSEKITEVINKVPIMLLLVGYLGSLGYDYYTFIDDPTSPLGMKKAELVAAKNANAKLQIKVTELENFVKTLEGKKIELRRLVSEFQQVSGSLSDHLDTPLFMKMIITEAKKVGLKVESLKPKGSVEKEFYMETTFAFSYRGIFAQLLIFLQRLASTTEIIRIADAEIKPNGTASDRFVEVKGDLEIKTYTYLSAKAEAMVKQFSGNSDAVVPGTPSVGDKSKPPVSPVSSHPRVAKP
jgi:Tfp pilus assembly protein PilO